MFVFILILNNYYNLQFILGIQGDPGLNGLPGDKGQTGDKGQLGEKGQPGEQGKVFYFMFLFFILISFNS